MKNGLKDLRFVIVGLPRTGTHALASVLHQHPDVVCVSEVLHPKILAVNGNASWSRDEVFHDPLQQVNAIWELVNGFSIQSTHTQSRKFIHAAVYIPGVKVIKPTRNFIDLVASRIIASTQSRWVEYKERERRTDKLNIGEGTVRGNCNHIQHALRWRDVILKNKAAEDVLELPYEQLIEDIDHWRASVFSFLGLRQDMIDLPVPKTKRQVPNWRDRIQDPDGLEAIIREFLPPKK